MEAIKELLSLDFTAVILTVFIIMSGIIAMYSIIGKFSEIIGKPVKWVKQRQLDHDLLEKNKKAIKDLKDKHEADTKKYEASHQELIDDVKNLTNIFVEKEIEDMRWEILNFCSALSNGRKYNREAYAHVFSTYERYEKILEENGKENGLVEESMAFIRNQYQEDLKNGTVK